MGNVIIESNHLLDCIGACFYSLEHFGTCTNSPLKREATDEAVLVGPLGHTQLVWHSRQQGQPHASLVRSSNVTSTFSNLCLSNLWHYGPELPAVAVTACIKTMFSICATEQSTFPLMVEEKHIS